MNYDLMCSCASCNYERDNERNPVNNAYKTIAIGSGIVIYIATYLVGSLPLVLGTTLALGALILSVTQIKDR